MRVLYTTSAGIIDDKDIDVYYNALHNRMDMQSACQRLIDLAHKNTAVFRPLDGHVSRLIRTYPGGVAHAVMCTSIISLQDTLTIQIRS